MKASWIDKGFQQQQGMAEAGLPIARDAPLGQRQHAGPHIRQVPFGQDQEAAVVRDELQASILGAKIPADPAITHAAFERRGRDTQLRYPVLAPSRDIPDRFTNLGQCAKIVVARHLFLIAAFFATLHCA